MRGNRDKGLHVDVMKMYAKPQKYKNKTNKKTSSPCCWMRIPLISFMNLTSQRRKPRRSAGLLCLLGKPVIIVYCLNKNHTILSLPVPIWYNDSLNIQSCAAVK